MLALIDLSVTILIDFLFVKLLVLTKSLVYIAPNVSVRVKVNFANNFMEAFEA
jgi:hypothetical protein